VNNINYILFCTVSKLLQITGQNLRFRLGGVPFFNTLILGETINSGLWSLTSRN